MKKLNTVIKSIVFVAAFLLMGTSINAQKFGYINSQELISSMPEVKEANAEIETLKLQLQKKGESMLSAYETKAKGLQQKQANGEISPVQLEQEAALLREEEAKILEYERTSQEKIAKKGEDLFKPIQDKVNQAIQDIAAEQGYTYIFDTSLGIILYADESTDVTPMVKSKLGIQ
jgi:outer membrane protein